MTIRRNPHNVYAPDFRWSRIGLLWITKRWIIATGLQAEAWIW